MLLEALDNKPGVAREIVTLNAGTALYSANVAAVDRRRHRTGARSDRKRQGPGKVDDLVRFTQQFKH